MGRAGAFRRSRDLYERERAAWLASHADEHVVIRDGTLVGFHESLAGVRCDSTSFIFKLESKEDEAARLRARASEADTWELICTPFLDTDMPESVDFADRVLRVKGYSSATVRCLRLLAAGGLWWNLFWWEWASLGLRDVLVGWIGTLGLLVLLLLSIGLFAGFAVVGPIALVFAVSAAVLVLLVRSRRWVREERHREVDTPAPLGRVVSDAERALLLLIAQSPDDDDPRLRYAAWLDEHGDRNRAELIRVQIEIASLPSDDPRRSELTARESELLAEHGQGFRRELPDWVKPPVHVVFRRGFAAAIGTKISRYGGRWPSELPGLSGLTLHDKEGCALLADEIKGLLSTPHLGQLRALFLEGIDVDPAGLAAAFEGGYLGRLESLEISEASLGPSGCTALARSPLLGQIRRLTLRADGLGPDDAARIAASPHATGLRELNLHYNRIGNDGARALAASPHLANLEVLVLTINGVSDEGARAIASSPHLRRLRAIALAGNKLTRDGEMTIRDRFRPGAVSDDGEQDA